MFHQDFGGFLENCSLGYPNLNDVENNSAALISLLTWKNVKIGSTSIALMHREI